MPAPRRQRTAAGRSHAGMTARSKRKRGGVPRSGKYSNQKQLVRKQFVKQAPKAFAHRQMIARAAIQWPLSAAPGAGLQPLQVSVPQDVWGNYTRGFDVAQVTSLAMWSRNCTCRVVLQPPPKSTAPQAYQFRVVTGFCKRQLNQVMHSTAGTSGMSDGLIYSFDPDQWTSLVEATLNDFVGTTNGNLDPAGAFDRTAFHVLTDQNLTISADATDAGGSTYYPSRVLNYNFATKKTMRLYPYSQSAGVPQSGQPDGYTPCNNPTLWIPFVAMLCPNFSQFTGDEDRPKIQTTWAHYWDQL